MGWLIALIAALAIGGTAIGLSNIGKIEQSNQKQANDILSGVQSGQTSAEDALAQIATGNGKLSPEQESYLSSMLSNQRTEEARNYETNMANTDLLRAAAQLQQLGLGASNVLQTGGSFTPNVAAASTPMMNNANQRLARQTSIANQMIGMAGRMASAGIYGGSLHAVKSSASKVASYAAHSAVPAVKSYDSGPDLTEEQIDELFNYFK